VQWVDGGFDPDHFDLDEVNGQLRERLTSVRVGNPQNYADFSD
jgi:hypothetical protein